MQGYLISGNITYFPRWQALLKKKQPLCMYVCVSLYVHLSTFSDTFPDSRPRLWVVRWSFCKPLVPGPRWAGLWGTQSVSSTEAVERSSDITHPWSSPGNGRKTLDFTITISVSKELLYLLFSIQVLQFATERRADIGEGFREMLGEMLN